MKSTGRAFLPAALLALAACQAQTTPPPTDPGNAARVSGQTLPAAVLEVVKPGPAAVWKGDVENCRSAATTPPADCLLNAMRRDRASTEALAITQQLIEQDNPGFISAWAEHDGVGIATLEFPFRANTNTGTWLVDSRGEIVDVDEDVLPQDARQQPSVQTFMTAHPDSWPVAPAQAGTHQTLPEGGVRLVFVSPLRDCRACDTLGELRRAYDFDAQRRFTGTQVLGIDAPGQATPQ